MPQFETLAFHIGYPKTSTTAIQEYLARNTDELERHGWCYFGGEILGEYVGINAMVLMWTLTGGRGEQKLPGHLDHEPLLVELFHRWLQQQRAKNLLISAEALCSFDENRWRQVMKAMEPYCSPETRIRVLHVVRHPLARALSGRNQQLKVTGNLAKHHMPGIGRRKTNELSIFFKNFFEDRRYQFEVRRFEDLRDEHLELGFLRWLGLPTENFDTTAPKKTINSSVSLETKWIFTTAGSLEHGTWDYKFWQALRDFPGTKDGWQEEEARARWASFADGENSYLASVGLKMYAFEEGFRPMHLEQLWPEAFCDAWKKRLETLSRAHVKRMLAVLQNLQPEVEPGEWPEEARGRFERLKRVTWKRAYLPKVFRRRM